MHAKIPRRDCQKTKEKDAKTGKKPAAYEKELSFFTPTMKHCQALKLISELSIVRTET